MNKFDELLNLLVPCFALFGLVVAFVSISFALIWSTEEIEKWWNK